jgi:hypothetical protein
MVARKNPRVESAGHAADVLRDVAVATGTTRPETGGGDPRDD